MIELVRPVAPGKTGLLPSTPGPRLQASNYLGAVPVRTPVMRRWSAKVPEYPVYGNYDLSDCVEAALGHAEVTWRWNAGRAWQPRERDIIHAYSQLTGYRPGHPETDRGTSGVDVMGWWRTVGIDGHKITAYAQVNDGDREEIKAAINEFGGIFVGLNLPELWKKPQRLWRAPRPGHPEDVPGSWDGHGVWVPDYLVTGPRIATWGGLQQMTWAAFEAYRQRGNCFCALSERWLWGGESPAKILRPKLLKDLAAIAA